MMSTADGTRIASAALRGVTSVARFADSNTTAERPVTQQTRHYECEGAQTSPSRYLTVAGAGTRFVCAICCYVLTIYIVGDGATAATIRAVIEETLDAAQTGRVV